MSYKLIHTVLACLLLTACSQDPFEKKSANETAKIITQASEDAMKRMGYQHSHNLGDRYAHCMMQRTNPFFNCTTLYQTMVIVLNKKGFKIKAAQLSDRAFYIRIKEELRQISVFSL